jgi:hypothetical protein
MGDPAAANRALDYLFNVQRRPDGSYPQNSRLSAEPVFGGLQMDEVSFPTVLAGELGRTGAADWWQIRRTQIRHPLLQHRDPARPTNPPGDHRRGHPRIQLQLLTDLRLDRIHDRPGSLAPVLRRGIEVIARAHCVPRNTDQPDNRLDR